VVLDNPILDELSRLLALFDWLLVWSVSILDLGLVGLLMLALVLRWLLRCILYVDHIENEL
jgi:hypothetical protein